MTSDEAKGVIARPRDVILLVAGCYSVFFVFVGSLGPFIQRRSSKLTWLTFVIIAIASVPILIAEILQKYFYEPAGVAS